MKIINVDRVKNKFKCGKLIALYLNEEVGIPVLGSDDKFYYFALSEKLEKSLDDAPFHIKIYLWLEGNNWRKEG